MACKKCGGVRSTINDSYPSYTVQVEGEDQIRIGAKSSFWITDGTNSRAFLGVGKIIKINNAAAIDLQSQGAPIWIIS